MTTEMFGMMQLILEQPLIFHGEVKMKSTFYSQSKAWTGLSLSVYKTIKPIDSSTTQEGTCWKIIIGGCTTLLLNETPITEPLTKWDTLLFISWVS